MEESFKIPSFQSGINEYVAEGLIRPYEAISAKNCVINDGALRTFKEAKTYKSFTSNVHTLLSFYDINTKYILYGVGDKIKKEDGTDLCSISNNKLDFLNFEYKGKKIVVFCSKEDVPMLHSSTETRKLKNRRITYKEDGSVDKYIDANGKEHTSESTITTYAPKGDFLELHYDRLWISGDKDNPDRIYFSTASVNGADIEDYTSPIEEGEANQHGGFLDVRSYDGSKIIGMKVIFNSVVVFKNRSAYKIFGNSPDNYQLVQLFNCNGAIADKSICVGNNGAFFLNSDGIYYYDGTNTNLISQKITKVIKRMSFNYAKNAVAIYKDNKYYLSLPLDDSQTNNALIEYDTINKSFMIYDVGNISTFLSYENDIYVSIGSDVKKLFVDNTSCNMYWKTPMFDFGKKNTRKMSNYIYFRGKGNGKVRFSLKTEKSTKSIDVELTSEEKLYRKKLKNKGRMMQLTISNVDNSDINIIAPELSVELDED